MNTVRFLLGQGSEEKGVRMRTTLLSALFVTAALTGGPSIAALAKPATAAAHARFAPTPVPTPVPTLVPTPSVAPRTGADAKKYAAREARNRSPQKFRGGGEVLVMSSGAVAVILLVVIIVILL
jgi:hypothetical protein